MEEKEHLWKLFELMDGIYNLIEEDYFMKILDVTVFPMALIY